MSSTVERALTLLELLSTYDEPVRLADLSRAASMNKSTAFRMLEVMSQLGYVTQDAPNGRYLMTTRMWEIGVRAFQRSDLRKLAEPFLAELVEATGETAILTRRDGDEVILVEKVDCTHPLQAIAPMGSRSPIHASSFGKAFLLADLALGRGIENLQLARFTAQTVTDHDTLRAELEEGLARRAVVGRDEYREGVSGVAAPVVGADGLAHGAIGISMPSLRLSDDSIPILVEKVAAVARRFSARIGHEAPTEAAQ